MAEYQAKQCINLGRSFANAVTAIAKEAGFSISVDDITQAQSELSDQELEGVAGGWPPASWNAFCKWGNDPNNPINKFGRKLRGD